ncbi:hypothetical protein OEZ86_014203 [Tetradesmus obliquus]|nr:hypothetical protein OEZ86_014203 [Tetradesmus obliquus]
MLQRHKRELLAHKKAVQRMGKKSKDELAKLDAEIEARHAQELQQFDAAAAAAAPAAATAAGKQAAAPANGSAAAADKASKYLVDLDLGDEEGEEAGEQKGKKTTKAQKRREKLAAKQAEREARIAAELEAAGPSAKDEEEAALKALLAPLGLGIKEIRADGHCLYRSLEEQLEATAAAAAAEEEEQQQPGLLNYQELRELAAEHIRQHKEQFAPFLLPEDDSEDPEQHFEKYCFTLETTAAWGGHLELTALAAALQRQIKVHAVGMPTVTIGDEFAGEGKAPPLEVCYLRHAFGLGEHYNSTKKARFVRFSLAEDAEAGEEEAGDEQQQQQDSISGQGLILRRQDLGASNKPKNVQLTQQYLLARAKASQLLGRVRSLSQPCGSGSSCRGCLCGWDVTSEDDRDVLSILASPAAYDARLPEHTGGFNLVNIPGDQDAGGSCGSCVAFAVAAAAESAVAARLNRSAASIGRLSPRYLFFCADTSKLPACNRGMELAEALSALAAVHKAGWPSEDCLPWAQPAGSPSGRCSLAPGCSRAGSNTPLPKGTFDYTRDAYDSIQSVARAQRHIRSGGGYWIVKNSFGPAWGNGGFFKVAYGSADVLDPAYTYGVTWQPAVASAAPAARLTTADADSSRALPSLPSNCIWYKARRVCGAPPPQAAAAAAAAAGTASGLCILYTIQWGDTLGKLSQRYSTTVARLARDNGIRNVNRIYAGRELRICS